MCDAWLGAFSSWPRRGSSAHRICVTGQVRAAEPHPPEGGRHHTASAPLFYNPRPPRGVPRPYAHWMGRPRGDWVDEKRNGKEQSEQNSKQISAHAGAVAKEQKQKAGKLLSEIVHPSRKCVLSSLIRNKCDLFIIIVETVVWGRLGGGCGRVSAAQRPQRRCRLARRECVNLGAGHSEAEGGVSSSVQVQPAR